MTQQVASWLAELERIWKTKKPNEIGNLCAEHFIWFETPFTKPLTKKEDLIKEWNAIVDQKDITLSFNILTIHHNVVVVHWSAIFSLISTNQKYAYDGIYKITLNAEGYCTEFRQWFNKK